MYRVLFDCRPVRSPISGVARYCIGVSQSLANSESLDLDLFVQAQGGNNEFLSLLPHSAQHVHSRIALNDRRIQNALLEFAPISRSSLLNKEYDILHETYFANLGSRRGASKVATIHDVIPLERPELFSKRNVFFSNRNFFRQVKEADCIIAVSEYTKNRILNFAPKAAERIVVIGNGVDPKIITQASSYIAPLESGDPLAQGQFVSHVGNIEPRKNLKTLAKAFDIAFPKGSGWRLVLAGRKNFEADRILAEIEGILGDRLLYLGPVTEKRKWQVISFASATAMTSEYEGFGIPIYESYAAETPVLIADNSSMSELAVRPEQLYPTFNAEALAYGFKQIDNDNDWVADSIKLGRAAVKEASWDKIASETKNVYNSLI